MAIFSIEEISNLYEPFPLEAHKIRQGGNSKDGSKTQWFVYLDRPAVQKRLDVLFPGEWSSVLGEFHRAGDYVTVTTTISIRGVARAFNGGASPKYATDEMDEDKEKSAATDSFRRAASMWGLGLYIYEGVTIWTSSFDAKNWQARKAAQDEAWGQFERWYHGRYSTPPQQNPPPTPPAKPAIVERVELDIAPAVDEAMPKAAGAENEAPPSPFSQSKKVETPLNSKKPRRGEKQDGGLGPAFAEWTKKHNVNQAAALAAMNVKYLSEWASSVDEMLDLLRNHFHTRGDEGGEA